MCMVNLDDDAPVVYRATTRTAAKAHTCDECGRTIKPGEKYETVAALNDGRWWTVKTCAHCLQVARWLTRVCGGYLHHAVLDDLCDHRTDSDVVRSWPLARLVALALGRRPWTTRRGLVPVDDVKALVDRSLEAVFS